MVAVQFACLLAIVVASHALPLQPHLHHTSDTVRRLDSHLPLTSDTASGRRDFPRGLASKVRDVFGKLLPRAKKFVLRPRVLNQQPIPVENATVANESASHSIQRTDTDDDVSHFASRSVADHSVKKASRADRGSSHTVSSPQHPFTIDDLEHVLREIDHNLQAKSSGGGSTDDAVPQGVADKATSHGVVDEASSQGISPSADSSSERRGADEAVSSSSVWDRITGAVARDAGSRPSPDEATKEDASDSSAKASGDPSHDSYRMARPVKMVLWTDFAPFSTEWASQKAPGCHIDAPYMANRSTSMHADYDVSDADVVVVNLSELERYYSLPRRKPEGQLWVATCWEPKHFSGGSLKAGVPAGGDDDEGTRNMIGDCSLLDCPETMSWFDAVSSYDRHSDFPALFTPPPEAVLRRSVPDFKQRGGELATVAVKDCRWDWRNSFVKSMNASLAKLHSPGALLSYGDCMRSAEEASCNGTSAVQVADGDLADEQLAWFSNRCASRPFQIVAENTDAPGYVTEKIWNALAAGAVPVYLGSKDAKDLVPPGSTMFAADYNSTDELVKSMLSQYEGGLAELHAWKQAPTARWGGWAEARRLSRATLPARLCAAAAARPAARPGGVARENEKPFVNPEREKLGKGRKNAARRALNGLVTAGSEEARELLDRARATQQATGVWPEVTLPPYREALGLSAEPDAAGTNVTTKEKELLRNSLADGEHEANERAMSTLWSHITAGLSEAHATAADSARQSASDA